jgi:hypothetical protein
MKTKTFKILLTVLLLSSAFLPVSFARADACSDFQKQFQINQSNITPGSKVDTASIVGQVPFYCSPGKLLTQVINLLLSLAGGAAVLFIILGGFWYMTSAGNEETAEKGRKTLVNAVIGLVVIILAATIVRIVVNTITGGGTGTTSTPPPAAGGASPVVPNPTSPTTNSGPANVMGDVAVRAVLPTKSNPNYTFIASVPTSDIPALKAACGGGDPVFLVTLPKNGGPLGQSVFDAIGDSSVTLLASTVQTLPDTVSYSVCGSPVGTPYTLPASFNTP